MLAWSELAQAQAIQRGAQPLALGEIRNDLPGEVKVGSRRAGLICAPAGALRWRDVEPRSSAARIALTRALKESGLAIDGPTDDWLDYRASAAGFRLIAAVTGLEMRACTPSVGVARALGRGHRLKGDGVMQIDWRIYRLADRTLMATTRTCTAFSFDAPELELADAAAIGMVENARLIGGALARVAPSLTVPSSLGLPAERCPNQARLRRGGN